MTEGIEAVWPEYESLASLEAGAGASSTLAPWVAREQVSSEGEDMVKIHPSLTICFICFILADQNIYSSIQMNSCAILHFGLICLIHPNVMQCNRYGYLTVDCVISGVLPDVRAVQPARQDDRGHGADGHLLHPRPLPRLPLLQETERPTSPGKAK